MFDNIPYDLDYEYDTYDTYKNPIPGKTYISPPLQDTIDGRTIRIITRGIDQEVTYKAAKVKNEIVLRETEGGRKIIKATVFETPREFKVLSIQDYTPSTDNPHKNGHAFIGDEIQKLVDFISDVQGMHFESKKYQSLPDEEVERLVFTSSQAESIVKKNPDLFVSVVQSNITTQDITAIAYRKKQLEIFEKYLDPVVFNEEVNRTGCKPEALWQHFFEKNTWIFGYGLGYVFLTELDDKKLEQVVQGFELNQHGKRIDAVMKTRGIISNLCFVEIKTHNTKLLRQGNPYRSGCYAPSDDLAGAVAQVQGSVADATRSLTEKLVIKDSQGDPTGEEIYNYRAKSFLVVGSLSEFVTDYGINQDKLRSFELFRKNIISPEIITFDELYERARFIVEYNNGSEIGSEHRGEVNLPY